MSVSPNQPVKASVVNNAFVSKLTDSTMVAVLSLADETSDTINNTQSYINELADVDGVNGEGDATAKNYSSNNFISNGDNRKIAIGKLDTAIDGVADDVATIDSSLTSFIAQKGAANGLCPLDASSKVDSLYLPSYVDDVLEYANLSSFPVTGETGKIYVAIDTGKIYRWSGSIYVEISTSAVNSVNGFTGNVIVTLNTMAGNETDQSPSVDAVKSYVQNNGGGGGGSFQWELSGLVSPVRNYIDGIQVLQFNYEPSNTIEMYALVSVPSTYNGQQIKLKNASFFANATGRVSFLVETTLIKTTTVIGTYPNKRTSTNANVNITVANQVYKTGDIDLTDVSGQINAVAVAANDILRLRLYRDSTNESGLSVTDVVNLITYSMSISFKGV